MTSELRLSDLHKHVYGVLAGDTWAQMCDVMDMSLEREMTETQDEALFVVQHMLARWAYDCEA
jgi:hypothetical protein